MESSQWLKETEKSWDSFSDVWSSGAKNMWETGSRKNIIPFIKDYLPPGGSICDLGCGEGYGTWKLSQEGFHTVGVDISNEMIQKAQKRDSGTGSLTFIQADISSLPFGDHQFDGVLAINSFEWTSRPLDALNEAKRILKPGGYAAAGILGPTAGPRKTHSFKRLYGEKVIMNDMLPWEFERLALETGWSLTASMGVSKKEADLKKLPYPSELKQALSFMWVFMLKKEEQYVNKEESS
ncbi:class I SAM-dependent methyltransferase [Peribacillus sp. SCS-37]|uniref:class I SAM-dependent methyltransferase n=1 Tax=Paraperibacillus esterisolvens TaxID=3115296 RepID=UPI0039058B8E